MALMIFNSDIFLYLVENLILLILNSHVLYRGLEYFEYKVYQSNTESSFFVIVHQPYLQTYLVLLESFAVLKLNSSAREAGSWNLSSNITVTISALTPGFNSKVSNCIRTALWFSPGKKRTIIHQKHTERSHDVTGNSTKVSLQGSEYFFSALDRTMHFFTYQKSIQTGVYK